MEPLRPLRLASLSSNFFLAAAIEGSVRSTGGGGGGGGGGGAGALGAPNPGKILMVSVTSYKVDRELSPNYLILIMLLSTRHSLPQKCYHETG